MAPPEISLSSTRDKIKEPSLAKRENLQSSFHKLLCPTLNQLLIPDIGAHEVFVQVQSVAIADVHFVLVHSVTLFLKTEVAELRVVSGDG